MTPAEEYVLRCNRWEHKRADLQRAFIRIGNWRLLIGIATAVLAWFVFANHRLIAWSLLAPVIAFVALVIWHSRVIRSRTLAERAIAYYGRGLARLNDKWIGTGNTGEQFRDAEHLYADDLDVFGKGGLFEFLSSSRTTAGEETLAGWLLSPASKEQIRGRHEAIRELQSRLDFREDLALFGADIHSGVSASKFTAWGSAAPVQLSLRSLRPLAFLLSLAGVTAVIGFFAQVLPVWFFASILAAGLLFRYFIRPHIAGIVSGIEANGPDLLLVATLLTRLECEQFTSPLLAELSTDIKTTGAPASKRLARLKRWIELLESSEHVLIRLIRPFLLWEEQAAMGIEAWRRHSGCEVGKWISALATFEALSSLASLAYERPHWCLPEIVPSEDPQFDAEELCHPLLAPARAVPNDVSLGDGTRLLIVSGSNMSGKSTLLRSVGLNAVLAWAGAPVAAKTLRTSPLRVAASIRVIDSLQDNRSRFYTEITRIRNIAALAKNGAPVLFLLDELLSGTNSHDRVIGAAGILRALFQAGAIGLITTHDLALVEIEREFGSGVRNVHFEDQIADGEIHFDYRLKPGIVTHSNALELMRAVGLEV